MPKPVRASKESWHINVSGFYHTGVFLRYAEMQLEGEEVREKKHLLIDSGYII